MRVERELNMRIIVPRAKWSRDEKPKFGHFSSDKLNSLDVNVTPSTDDECVK